METRLWLKPARARTKRLKQLSSQPLGSPTTALCRDLVRFNPWSSVFWRVDDTIRACEAESAEEEEVYSEDIQLFVESCRKR